MKTFKHLAGAVLAATVMASPAFAVTESDTVTFAQFTQRATGTNGAPKVAQYTNTGAGNTLTITDGPVFLVVTAFGPTGFYPATMSLSANSSATVTDVGPQLQQTGFTGNINFTNGSNYLTVNFINATFAFDRNGGSASLLSTDPSNPISFTSSLMNLPVFTTENFSLAFTGITPLFGIAANGFGSAFNANIAGSFAGAPELNPDGGAVPEPATWAMLLTGFGMVGFSARRRNRMVTVAS